MHTVGDFSVLGLTSYMDFKAFYKGQPHNSPYFKEGGILS